jgi:undecaprenyl-diphosphatase
MLGNRWLVMALTCAVLFALVTAPVAIGGNWPGEEGAVAWAVAWRTPLLTSLLQGVTFFGSAAVGLGLSSGVTVLLLVARRRVTRDVFLPLVAMVGSAPINFGLRAAIGRLRPGVSHIAHRLPELAHPFQRWSYPSGHAMTATICYGTAAYLLVCGDRRKERAVAVVYAIWLALVGFSRVYVGVHWPSDVVGGYLAGGFWLALCIGLLGPRRAGGE